MINGVINLKNEVNMLNGNINRMCVSTEPNEIDKMFNHAVLRLADIYTYNKMRCINAPANPT